MVDEGAIPNLDAVASMVSSMVMGGAAHGCRAIDIRVDRGIDLRLLPDRGLDIGAAWYAGIPLAWISAIGEAAPITAPKDQDWGTAFGGGLVATCGLRNVGRPSEGHGQHGRYSHLRTTTPTLTRQVVGDRVICRASASAVDGAAASGRLLLEREIQTCTGSGEVLLTDTTTNTGPEPEPAPILYHINVGAPLWANDAYLQLDSRAISSDNFDQDRLPDWRLPTKVKLGAQPMVLEHIVESVNGWASAQVVAVQLGVALRVEWETANLPRFHQWINAAPGIAVMGLEPSNCSVKGREYDRAEGRLPILDPGESRTTRLRISARLLEPNLSL